MSVLSTILVLGIITIWGVVDPSKAQSTTYGQTRYIQFSFSSLFSAGGGSADNEVLRVLQGGAHDPKQTGFTVQNLELSITGAVDPFLNGEAHLIFQIDAEGESVLEVEEAFLTTQTLPYGLQVKAGTFFTEFGRLNPQHPHSWSTLDQPVINTRMFGGDGLRGPGARLAWLSPLPWFSELYLGLQNPAGETAFSFLSGGDEEEFAGYPLGDRQVRSLSDMLWSARWFNSATLGETVTANVGISGLNGPNRTGPTAGTAIYGSDLYVKWKPVVNDKGWPFISLQGEWMERIYELGNGGENDAGAESLHDTGYYLQMLWGYRRGWVAGVRLDRASGTGGSDDPLRDKRTRRSLNVTWYPSEYSKLRLQYNLDQAAHLEEEHASVRALWLQFEFLMGRHAGHKF